MLARRALLAGLCIAAVGTVAQGAVVLSDFEPASYQSWQGLNGWFSYAGNPISIVPVDSTNAMQMVIANQYWGQETAQAWANPALSSANFNANPSLSFDLMLPTSGFNWPTLSAQIQMESTGDANWSSTWQAINVSQKDVWQHITVDLSSGLPRTGTFNNLILFLNPNWGPGTYTNQTVYVDNFVVSAVPEPAVLGVAATGAAMMLRRRRQVR